MKRTDELAIEVLLESGLLERAGDAFKWAGKELQVQDRKESDAVAGTLVATLPWLRPQTQEGAYIPKTPEQRILCAFKMALGVDWQDRNWDKAMFPRYARSAKQLLTAFRDEQEAAEFILNYGEEMKQTGLNWGLDAVVRRAFNTMGERK
jgi:hypothetical protein